MDVGLGSPLKTIRAFCLECSGTANEVKLCPCTSCKLYPYRFGHDPRRAVKELSDEEREIIRKRLSRKNLVINTSEKNEGGQI